MKQKVYVIRPVEYYYTDEYHMPTGLGGIRNIYRDKAEARNKLKTLESKTFRERNLDRYIYSDHQQEVFNKYLKKIFNDTSLYIPESESDLSSFYINPSDLYYLPKQVTDEQIMEIRKIVGIKFYELAEFEVSEVLYAVFSKYKDYSDIGCGGKQISLFFNTYEEALDKIGDLFFNACFTLDVEGSLEDLTEQPSALRSIIEQNRNLNYDPLKSILEINYEDDYPSGEFISLNALLKKPLFEIRAVPLLEAEKTFEKEKEKNDHIYVGFKDGSGLILFLPQTEVASIFKIETDVLYTIVDKRNNKILSVEKDGETIVFFNTPEDALNRVEELFYDCSETIEETLEELTDQPTLLRSLVKESKYFFKYTPDGNIFGIGVCYDCHKNFISLNALLKKPIFEICPASKLITSLRGKDDPVKTLASSSANDSTSLASTDVEDINTSHPSVVFDVNELSNEDLASFADKYEAFNEQDIFDEQDVFDEQDIFNEQKMFGDQDVSDIYGTFSGYEIFDEDETPNEPN